MLTKTLNLLQTAGSKFSPTKQSSLVSTHRQSYTALMPVEEIRAQAKEGDAEQQYVLGNLYAYGETVAQDYQQAAHWFYQAAKQDHTGALYKMGVCFEYGYGVSKDHDEARRWYSAAQHAGYNEAAITPSTNRVTHFIPLTIAMLVGYFFAQLI